MKIILELLKYLGIYPAIASANIKGLFWYFSDLRKFKKELKVNNVHDKFRIYPIMTDKFDTSGKARGQYFYQDLYVANQIFLANPVKHVDIGSRIDGFVAHVASFRKIEVYDIRPLTTKLLNISFIQADLMQFDEKLLESTPSLSCLHTIEHFGLGRYNDPIDILGHEKGFLNMYKLLQKGGRFYFSTQIGPQRIEFNAHRVFSLTYLLSLFDGKFSVDTFSYIDDKDNFFQNVPLTQDLIQSNAGCKMGCGIFVLTKI